MSIGGSFECSLDGTEGTVGIYLICTNSLDFKGVSQLSYVVGSHLVEQPLKSGLQFSNSHQARFLGIGAAPGLDSVN
jgi:hypothetical protein